MKFARTLFVFAAAFGMVASSASATTTSITIPMKALNGSGENGTSMLTQVKGGVQVVVTLKNAPDDAQPTHIHIGTCGNINKAPEFALLNTVNGKSSTVVKGVTLKQLLAGHYAVNVHKSTSDLATYVSCGNITK